MASRKNLCRRSSNSSMSKRQKNEEETLTDRISELPEEHLLQMLSHLPTKDAVALSLLSKRWRSLWKSIHNFHFSNANYNQVQNFISFVDNVLIHSNCSKINKFQYDFHGLHWEFNSKISKWLNFAVGKNVEHVALHSYPYHEHLCYELPVSMYTCSSLITLTLTNWVFDKRLPIAWNSLKSLTLHATSLDDEDVMKLLSSCPVLEAMELSLCEKCRRLDITSSNLKRLTLSNHLRPYVGGYDFLDIYAPHLKHLDISGDLGRLKCRLLNVSSLVIASLTFSIICITLGYMENDEEDGCSNYHRVIRNLILDYLEKLSNVTELIIGSWFAEVVFMLQLEGVMLPELRCKCLTLKLCVSEYNVYGIASLLQTLPLMDSLNIHIKDETFDDPPCKLVQSYLDEVKNINLPSWIPDALFPNLKNVKIVGCLNECLKEWSEWGSSKLFELSKFLLKNAVALQKLVIVAKRRKCCICSESCVSRHLSQLAKKLIDSPKSSTNFVISYQEIA